MTPQQIKEQVSAGNFYSLDFESYFDKELMK